MGSRAPEGPRRKLIKRLGISQFAHGTVKENGSHSALFQNSYNRDESTANLQGRKLSAASNDFTLKKTYANQIETLRKQA